MAKNNYKGLGSAETEWLKKFDQLDSGRAKKKDYDRAGYTKTQRLVCYGKRNAKRADALAHQSNRPIETVGSGTLDTLVAVLDMHRRRQRIRRRNRD